MTKIKGKIATPKFNGKFFNKALQKALKDAQREAIKYWLYAVIQHTPVYTGTARATLMPLGRAVRYTFSIVADPSSKWKKFFRYNGFDYPLGIGYGKRYQEYLITQTFAPYRYTYTFKFNMDLLYAVWNNRQPAPRWLHLRFPTPWEGLEIGARSFQTYVTDVMPKKLPDLRLFVKWTQIGIK